MIYSVDGRVEHRATVTAVDGAGNVTAVSGIAGVTDSAVTTTPEQGWQDPRAKATYYRKMKDNRTEEQRAQNINRTKTFSKPYERAMRDVGRRIEKEIGPPPKPPKLKKPPKND